STPRAAPADPPAQRVARRQFPFDGDAQSQAGGCRGANRPDAGLGWRGGNGSSMMRVRPAWSFEAAEAGPLGPSEPQDVLTPEEAWGDSTGAGVRVAIVDSGVDNDHPAIAGAVKAWIEPFEADGKLQFRSVPHGDSSGHGTACAGIVLSLAPDA